MQNQTWAHPGRHAKALETLSKIFKNETDLLPSEYLLPYQPTSMNPTKPRYIWATPHVHTQRTINNTPLIIPHTAPTSFTTSEGEGVAAPSEGAQFTTYKGEDAKYWYSTQREKRKITRVKKKVGPPRWSARLNKKMNLPSERKTSMEKIQDT